MDNKINSSPFQKFIRIESLSGLLLLISTVIALVWANSGLSDLYQNIWNYKIGISSDFFSLEKPVILWVNDGLMAVFFFLIGLEIKRELLIGELNSVKKMTFPLAGALGGMIVPLGLYLLINRNPEASHGWGIPMATDIAFSLAIIKVLGHKVPLALKVFLTAFAIIDDLGAVLIIALFYTGNLNFTLLIIALALLAVLYLFSAFGYYSKFLLLTFGISVWVLFLKSGVHPTIAGILLAFSVPVRQKIFTKEFLKGLSKIVRNIENAKVSEKPILTKEQIEHVDELEDWTANYQSPLQHLEHRLHDWVAYMIIPIFALANAGVSFQGNAPVDLMLVLTIGVSLLIGKSIGIPLFVFVAKRLKLVEIPSEISKSHIVGVSFLAGIGFTMSIFISGLAFAENADLIASAKIGIIGSSVVAAVIGYFILNTQAAKKETET